MTTTTATAPVDTTSLSHLTFGGLIRSEVIKLRSLRSTFWCYVLILVLNIGLALLISVNLGAASGGGATIPHGDQQTVAVRAITAGVTLTQLVSAVLGALMITGEYGTGMIRSTFTAAPKRTGALAAKALVFGITTFVIGLVSIVISAFVAMPGLSNHGYHLDFGDGDVWLAFVGGAGYLALVGLIAFGLGAIIRASAGGIAAAIGLVFVVPIFLQIFSALTSAAWVTNVAHFLPDAAGQKFYTYASAGSNVTKGIVTLDGTQGLLVVLAWTVVLYVIANVLVKRRDA